MCDDTFTSKFRELASVPDLKGGYIVKQSQEQLVVESDWSQRNLISWQRVQSSCLQLVVGHTPSIARPTPLLDNVQLTGRTGESWCRLIQGGSGAQEQRYLLVHTPGAPQAMIPLKDSKLHGKVYSDPEMSSLTFSPDLSLIALIAEEFTAKPSSLLSPVDPDKPDDGGRGEQFVWKADWGEQMSGQSRSVVVVLPRNSGPSDSGRILLTPPSHYSGVGQLLWVGPRTLVGVAYIDSSPRLGLVYCRIRESVLFSVSLDEKTFTELTPRGWWVGSPRLSLCGGRLVYLRGPVGGPHMREAQLVLRDMTSGPGDEDTEVSVIIDYYPSSLTLADGSLFAGLTGAAVLPLRCFMDADTLAFSAYTRHQLDTFMVDLVKKEVRGLRDGLTTQQFGSVTLHDVTDKWLLYSTTNFTSPATLHLATVMPMQTTGNRVCRWCTLMEACPGNESAVPEAWQAQWQAETKSHSALYCGPTTPQKDGSLRPLIVYLHGGPHSIVTNAYSMSITLFVSLGYSVVLPNYRGSVGEGRDFIHALLGKIGDIDVKDCHQTAVTCLEKFSDVLDPTNVFLYGGSHGGFLATHLTAQHPDFYRAVCCRNPVTDIATMVGVTDIPDWAHVEVESSESPTNPPSSGVLAKMASSSPLWGIDSVKAPTLLQLGTLDRRVPSSQGIKYHEMLLHRGVPTRINLYEDSHSLSKVEHEADAVLQTLVWFRKYARAVTKAL